MKNLLLTITILFSLNIYSQMTTIVSDEFNDELYSSYDEHATLRISFDKTYLILQLDLDGNYSDYSLKVNKYELLSGIYLKWSDYSKHYNIMFILRNNNDQDPISGIVDLSNNSILLFYLDNSSLLYIGEGITIII